MSNELTPHEKELLEKLESEFKNLVAFTDSDTDTIIRLQAEFCLSILQQEIQKVKEDARNMALESIAQYWREYMNLPNKPEYSEPGCVFFREPSPEQLVRVDETVRCYNLVRSKLS